MSAKVTNYYRQERETKGTARLILMILAERANEDGSCFPSVQTLADDCMKSQRTIQRTIKELESKGKVGRAFNTGKLTATGRTNMYYLNDYRVSVGLNPIITLSEFTPKKMSPHAKQGNKSTQAVTNKDLSGDKTVTQTKYTKPKSCINHNHKRLSPDNHNESATQISVERSKDKSESAMHVSQSTAQPSKNIVQPSTVCGDKDFLIKEEVLNEAIFPIQITKVERAEITNLLVKQQIPHESWQDLIDTLAYQIKHKAIASKAGYFVGILKKFKAGEFTTSEAQKIQSKRQPKQTSSAELKNKVEQIAEKNRKPIIDEKTAKMIEIINSKETKAELQQIYLKLREFNGDYIMNAWSKRFNEVRA